MLKPGDKVKMNDKYYVSEVNKERVFTVKSEPWEVCVTLVVRLEGYSGCYAMDGLTKVNVGEVNAMKEVTRITTVRITEIVRDTDKVINAVTTEESKQDYKEELQLLVKSKLGVDDVVVDDVQDFIMDVKE